MYIVLYFWTCLQHLYFECFQGSIVIYFQIFWEAEYRMEHRSPTRTKYSTDIKHSNTKYSTITCPTEQTNGETTIQTTTTSNEGMSCDWYNSQVRQQPPPMKVCHMIDTILKSDNNHLQWRYVVWLIQFSSVKCAFNETPSWSEFFCIMGYYWLQFCIMEYYWLQFCVKFTIFMS